MPPDTRIRLSFLSRILFPVAAFVLLLSIAGNVFLIVTRASSRPGNPSSFYDALPSSSASLGSIAFGDVLRPVSFDIQSMNATGSILKSVSRYVLPESRLPSLPSEMPVYRDQGMEVDTQYLSTLFRSLHAPVDPIKMQLLADTYDFKSSDATLKISLSLPTRKLTITRNLQAERTTPPERADDAEVLALAKTFAATLSIDLTTFGEPAITETKPIGDQPRKTFVTWPMTIGGTAVLGIDSEPVPALSMQIGRVSHRAINATMSLLSSDVLASSLYPVLSGQMITVRLMSGGLLPIPMDPSGPEVTYEKVEIVYVLLPQDLDYPMYLIPAIRISFMSDGKTFKTLLPILDRKHFDWKKGTPEGVPI